MSARTKVKGSLNKATSLEIRREGCKAPKQTEKLFINYDKRELHQLVSCVEKALQKSPSDPVVCLRSLSYLPAETGRVKGGGEGSSALDGTPFRPHTKSKPKKRKSADGKQRKYVLLTPKNFNPKVFWAMDKVCLAAVVKGDGEDREEAVNDENDRRLSNGGSVSTTTTSPAGSGGPARLLSQPRVVSPSSPPRVDRRSRPKRTVEPSGSGGGGSGPRSDSSPSVVGARASSPIMSTLSSMSSVHTHIDGRELDSSSSDGSSGSDGGGVSPGSKQSSTSFTTTILEGGNVSVAVSPLASPGPGKRSVLFRRASAASRLPPEAASSYGSEGGVAASIGVEDRAGADKAEAMDGGVIDDNTDNGAWVGKSAGLACGGGGSTNRPNKTLLKSGTTTSAIARSTPCHKPINPRTRPSPKKPTATTSNTTETASTLTSDKQYQAATTPRKQQQQQQPSARGAKPSDGRMPPFKAAGAQKAKLPLRTNATTVTAATTKTSMKTKTPAKPRVPRFKGTVPPAAGGSGGSGDGSGAGSTSPSKRGPPRVSASGHMAWERNLRSVSKIQSTKKDNSPPGKKDALPGGMRKGGKAYGGGGGGRGNGGGGSGNDGNGGGGEDGRPSIGTWATAQNYLQILKEISGKDEEELEWLVVAKKGEGVKKSEKRRESAETEYYRLLYQESVQEAGLKLLKDRRLEVALRSLGKLGQELGRVTELLEDLGTQEMNLLETDDKAEQQESTQSESAAAAAAEAAALADVATVAAADVARETAATDDDVGQLKERAAAAAAAEAEAEAEAKKVAAAAAAARDLRQAERERVEQARIDAEEKLGQLLEEIVAAKEKIRALGAVLKEECGKVPGGGGSALETVVGVTADVCTARELIAPARAKSGLSGVEAAAKTLAEELSKTRSGSQAALARMEKWRERKEALPEYAKEVAAQEKAWFEREKEANELALRRIRKLIPVDVTRLTVGELEQRALDAGSLYPRELALRIKENRLLHWVVTHPDDIARANFLRGDHAHFFTNLEKYDLVEMRAIMASLPAKFEVDADGRKGVWREVFLQRVQGLVAQERGDTVSGGWDPAISARREVCLPALTAEQTRRKEYFYPTMAEVEEAISKLNERQRRLEEKQAKLAQVKDKLLPEAKEEYANVLEDTRHPANKEAFSPQDLRRARDQAKSEVDRLANEAKRLEGAVLSAERTIGDIPYTVQSLRAEAEATQRLLSMRARKRRLLDEQHATAAAAAAAAASPGKDEDEDEVASALAAVVTAVVEKADEEEEELVVVEEGMEVEGAFDPAPELRSRFADKSSSLRFVTADEEARMRKEELARVFAVRDKGAGVAAAPTEPVAEISGLLAGARRGVNIGSIKGADDKEGALREEGANSSTVGAAAAAAAATATCDGCGSDGRSSTEEGRRSDPAIGTGRMKAFGAILEKTLSKSLLGRAPPPGTIAAAAAAAGVGVSRKKQVLMSPARQSEKKETVLTPPCRPKSKFFQSITSPTKPNDTDRGAGPKDVHAPLPPPPPATMMGMLSQIRARGGEDAAGGGRGGPHAGMGGLLAQIRAAQGSRGDGNDVEDGKGSCVAPPSPPQVPALPLPPRSLFATAEPPSRNTTAEGALRGPPPDFFAQLRAKASEKQALRRAAEAGAS